MKNIEKITVSALFITLIILGMVKFSMDNLKKETENGFQEIAKLHANIFTDQINQIFNNINNTMDNLTSQIQNEIYIDKTVKSMLGQNPYIRSINILNSDEMIIFSSNKKNLNQQINTSNYYPKPFFNNEILRFGKTVQGRDLFDKDTDLSYIPIMKKVLSNSGDYTILITINNDYITNRYQKYLTNYSEELEITRFDDILLYSSLNQEGLGKNIKKNAFYLESKEKSLSSGLDIINNKKYIVAYQSTNLYPLVISVKLDYEKNLKEWENKTLFILLFIGFIILLIAFIIIKLLLRYQNSKNKEIEYQEKLLKNQEKIKHAYIVYENTNDGILITDKDKNIIDVNKAFTLNSGYSLTEVVGKNPRFLQSYLHDKDFYKDMWSQINTTNHWHGEVINKTKDGELYVELLTINTVYDNDMKIKNYVGIFTNITKQKEQEVLLKEQERFINQQSKMASMGEMLENIAHQWRQPLSIISTAATGIKMEKEFGLSNEESEMKKLTIINDSAQHLSKTIDDFRDFFKPNKQKENFFIEDVVKQSMNILDSKFVNRNIQIEKNIFDAQIQGYKGEMVQVFMNILNNARDALESVDFNDRFIIINIYKEEKYVIIEIKDSAGGVDKSIIDKVFEPYFTTKHKSQGTGIGLYMTEEIITKHMHGKIDVFNSTITHENKIFQGACFKISIPFV